MAIERLVIVADAHLGGVSPEVESAFLEFLAAVPDQGDGLLINGDLFAFWFAYRRAIPRRGTRVMLQLAKLAERLPVFMTGGNHDRWGGDFWDTELGIRYSADELALPLSFGAGLAVHGDGIAEANWRGRVMHAVFKHPITSLAYRLIHPDVGFWLVDRFSGTLADSTRDHATLDAAAARQQAWAKSRMERSPEISLLAMGHTHRAAVFEVSAGRWYVNPGAWLDGYSFAVASREGVTLKRFRG